MILINNKKEFDKQYPYTGYKPKKYPTHYPCLVNWESAEGGLMGDYYYCEVVYIPSNVDADSFIKGVNAKEKILQE